MFLSKFSIVLANCYQNDQYRMKTFILYLETTSHHGVDSKEVSKIIRYDKFSQM